MFTAGWKNKDSEKAIKWVNRQPENARALAKAAEFSSDPAVRAAAVARITDEAMLLRLVKAYCYEAVSAMQDTETLFALAKSPAFWGAEDKDVSWRDLCWTDPAFSRVRDAWTVSLDVPKADERLKMIRMREKQYGFAKLAFSELRSKGSDAQIEGLLSSRYDNVRPWVIWEILRRHPERAESYAYDETLELNDRVEAIKKALDEHPERAESYADDDTLSPTVRIEAVKRVTDPERRRRYCSQYNAHEWQVVSCEQSECGDHLDTYTHLRCIYCGKEETRSSRRRL